MFCPKCGYDGIYSGHSDIKIEECIIRNIWENINLKHLYCAKCNTIFFIDFDDL